MTQPFITEDEVERALDYLRDNAEAIGAARGRMIAAGYMVKHVKALVMQMFSDLPVSAQEREALASKRYVDAINEEAEAAAEFEKMKSLREAAALKIEAWRTLSSTHRAMKI